MISKSNYDLGLTVDSYETGISYFDRNQFITFKIKNNDEVKTWLAQITGIDKKFGFKREFAKSNYYSESDTLTRVQYIVGKNRLYEYRNFLIDEETKSYESGYIAITEEGEVLTLTHESVRKLLHMRCKGDKIPKKEIKEIERKQAEIEASYVNDDVPF